MKIKSAVFTTSAPDLKSCRLSPFPEFAFIGRSNVGKSSLINMLTERRDLAKVSATPGKTQLINFFRINDRWDLVDLPGYGYAKADHAKRDGFGQMISDYLSKRDNLECVFTLIDCRLPPQPIDLQFLQWLESVEANYALVFTKADKLSPTAVGNNVEVFKDAVRAWRTELPPSFISSAEKRVGRSEILAFVEETLSNRKAKPTL